MPRMFGAHGALPQLVRSVSSFRHEISYRQSPSRVPDSASDKLLAVFYNCLYIYTNSKSLSGSADYSGGNSLGDPTVGGSAVVRFRRCFAPGGVKVNPTVMETYGLTAAADPGLCRP